MGAGLVTRLHDAREAQYIYEVTYDSCHEREKAQQHTNFSVCHDG
jgi:hypothetical protein